MKMFHILSEFTPTTEEQNYFLPTPHDFKVIGHYTVRCICMLLSDFFHFIRTHIKTSF